MGRGYRVVKSSSDSELKGSEPEWDNNLMHVDLGNIGVWIYNKIMNML